MKTLTILQTATPDYRNKVFQYFKKNLGKNFSLFSGNSYFEASIKTDKTIDFLNPVKNYYLFNRKLLFQTGMWKETLHCNLLVLELNPRIISNWCLLILRKLTSKKTILWGHAWPRNGIKSRSDGVRNIMRMLSDEIIVYTEKQAEELRKKMPYKKITAAPNSFLHQNEMGTSPIPKQEITNLIYVGRLSKPKKSKLLIDAFINVISNLPAQANLIIIGDGEQKEILQNLVIQNKLEHRIKILGQIYDFEQLKKYYAKSLFSVSPGYVGLSITQSFGFGVPMLISKDENHSPEIEAAIVNENSIYFETGNKKDLSKKIIAIYQNKEKWLSKREVIVKFCQKNYSIENMSQIFIDLVK